MKGWWNTMSKSGTERTVFIICIERDDFDYPTFHSVWDDEVRMREYIAHELEGVVEYNVDRYTLNRLYV